jgi:hypothetical protein
LTVTSEQIRRIHALKSQAGLDEDSYRAALRGRCVESSKAFTSDQAADFIGFLETLPKAARKPAATPLGGEYAGILRALWIAGWNLGVIRSREDAALVRFVKSRGGVEHPRFLRAEDARNVIEALKSWLARDAGVRWPADRASDPRALKIAVLEAQWRRLVAIGAVESFGPAEAHDGLQDYVSRVARGSTKRIGALTDPGVTPAELDEGAMALGRKLRAALAAAEKAQAR